MAFKKQYPKRKDWLRPYYGCKAVDSACRCNGSCGYCRANRLYQDTRNRSAADEEIREFQEQVTHG